MFIEVFKWCTGVWYGSNRGMAGILTRQVRPLLVRMEFWPHGLNEAGNDPRSFLEEMEKAGWKCRTTDGEIVSDKLIEKLSKSKKFVDLTLTHPCLSGDQEKQSVTS